MRRLVLMALVAAFAGVLTAHLMQVRAAGRAERAPVETPGRADVGGPASPAVAAAKDSSEAAPPMLSWDVVSRPAPVRCAHATMEEYWERQRRIRERLPHLSADDAQKFDYYCPADINRDDVVDEADVVLFLDVWRNDDEVLGGSCDLNHDGMIDQLDLFEFFRLYHEGGCDPDERRSLRAIIC